VETFQFLKNAGVVFGKFANHISISNPTSKDGLQWDTYMLKVWGLALKQNTSGVEEVEILSISHSVVSRTNPWSQFYIPTHEEVVRWGSNVENDIKRSELSGSGGLLFYLMPENTERDQPHIPTRAKPSQQAHPQSSTPSTNKKKSTKRKKKKKKGTGKKRRKKGKTKKKTKT